MAISETSSAAPTVESSVVVPRTLGRDELALIVAFWLLLGAVMGVSRLFDPRGGGTMSQGSIAFASMAIAQALLWALLTPLLFVAVGRIDAERDGRVTRALLLVVIGVAAALLVHLVGNVVRLELLPNDFGGGFGGGGRGPRGPRGPRPGPWRIERFGFINDMIIAGGVLAAGIARDVSLRYRARKEQATRLQAQLAQARLDALRRQLDPHFLFNTLNAVSALVERDPRGVRRMIARLSELLRHSMEGSDAAEVPLEREIGLLQLYVDIMMVRFQGRLEVAMVIDDGARDGLVPQLVLQPLVENAIRHGVSQLEGAGHITVRVQRDGERLVLRVIDNGRGLAAAPEQSMGGVGLRNTRARLAELYGDAARFTLEAGPKGGAVAQVVLPYHTAPRPVAGGPTS